MKKTLLLIILMFLSIFEYPDGYRNFEISIVLWLVFIVYISFRSYTHKEPIGFSLIYSILLFILFRYSIHEFIFEKIFYFRHGGNYQRARYGIELDPTIEFIFKPFLRLVLSILSIYLSIKMIKYRSKYDFDIK